MLCRRRMTIREFFINLFAIRVKISVESRQREPKREQRSSIALKPSSDSDTGRVEVPLRVAIPPIAFMSYVNEDSEPVIRIAAVLREFEVNVWIDKTALKAGLRWQDQIRKGISEGDFFLACFSEAYLSRAKTYMNEELTLAIEELRRRRTNRAWFIPVKLNACEIPDRNIGAGDTLRSIQWVDLYTDWATGIEKILAVVVPGSEHIPTLIAQLEHTSARRRIEAIEALGRLGPLAKAAIPRLLERVPIEEREKLGALPLAAISDALRKLGYSEDETFRRIESSFERWQISSTMALKLVRDRKRLENLKIELRSTLRNLQYAIEERRSASRRIPSLLESAYTLVSDIGYYPRIIEPKVLAELRDRLISEVDRKEYSHADEFLHSVQSAIRWLDDLTVGSE